MSKKTDLEKTKAIAEQVHKRIATEKLPPTPEIYELWFNYYSHSNPEIGRAVDLLENAGKEFTTPVCMDLYERYLSDSALREVTAKSEQVVLDLMNEVMGIMGEVQGSAGDFGGALQGANKNLQNVKSVDDLKKVMTEVFSDTKRMMKKNQDLEKKLDTSSARMKELRREVEQVRKEAKTDGLTGLMNRKAFDENFLMEIQKAHDEDTPLSLLVLDIDHFKNFNDTYGHQVGDQVLRLVSRTMVDNIKGRDTAARYGGEEFVIILPETNVTGAVAAGNMLRKVIMNKDLVNKNTGDSLGQITVSIGAADLIKGERPEQIIERADTALYTAKQNGRNQVCAAPRPEDMRDAV